MYSHHLYNVVGGLLGYPTVPGQGVGPGFGPGPVPGPWGPGPVPGPGVGPGFGPGPVPGPWGPGPIPGPGPVPGPGAGPGPVPGPGHGAPTSPPPSFVPPKPGASTSGGFTAQAVNPGSLIGCRYRYVYIWQRNGDAYWAYLTFVGRNSVAGYRWIGFTWVYFGLDARFIDQFFCS